MSLRGAIGKAVNTMTAYLVVQALVNPACDKSQFGELGAERTDPFR